MATDKQRGWVNGRRTQPANYARPKLTPLQRDEIRRRVAEGETFAELAVEYGVSARTIRMNA